MSVQRTLRTLRDLVARFLRRQPKKHEQMPSALTQVNPFELDGFWWEAGENPEEKGAYGTLSFSPDAGARLSMLRPAQQPFPEEPAPVVVHGRAVNETPCTLLGVLVENATSWWPGGHEKVDISANLVVHGALLKDANDLESTRAWLTFAGLRELLSSRPTRGGGSVPGIAGEGTDLADQEVRLPNAKLTFRLAWSSTVAPHRHVREREAGVLVELDEPAAYEEWIERWAKPLEHLITFANREPSRLESFVATLRNTGSAAAIHPAIRRAGSDEMWERQLVEFIRREAAIADTGPRFKYERPLFSLASLGEGLDAVLARWFEMHEQLRGPAGSGLSGASDAFFTALSSRMYLENRLLNVMSAAESYHRTFLDTPPLSGERHDELVDRMLASLDTDEERNVYRNPLRYANSASQRRRLRDLCQRAADVIPELAPLCGPTVGQLVATRNYLTHLDVPAGDETEGFELFKLIERLVMVLQVNFLMTLGVGTPKVGDFVRRSYAGQEVF